MPIAHGAGPERGPSSTIASAFRAGAQGPRTTTEAKDGGEGGRSSLGNGFEGLGAESNLDIWNLW